MLKSLTFQQREKKLKEWKKTYRRLHPIWPPWKKIPDSEVIPVSDNPKDEK
jgi:hypothetical protein